MGSPPPRLPARILARLLPTEAAEYVLGDLEEAFRERVDGRRAGPADRAWYWRQAASTIVWCRLRAPLGRLRSPGDPQPAALLRPSPNLRAFARGVGEGARTPFRRPGTALLVAVTLAGAVGPAAAVFNLERWLLSRTPPGVADPGGLVTIRFEKKLEGGAVSPTGISVANLRDLEGAAPAFSALGGRVPVSLYVSVAGFPAEPVHGEAVSEHYFSLLGVGPSEGRLFTPEEMGPEARGDVVVVSAGFRERLRREGIHSVVGRTLAVNGHPLEVVGVVGGGFQGLGRLHAVELWMPPAAYPRLRHFGADTRYGSATDRGSGFFMEVVGRTRPGADLRVAEAQLLTGVAKLIAEHPETNAAYREHQPRMEAGIAPERWAQHLVRQHRPLLWFGAGLLLLLGGAAAASLRGGLEEAREGAPVSGRAGSLRGGGWPHVVGSATGQGAVSWCAGASSAPARRGPSRASSGARSCSVPSSEGVPA